MNISVTELSLAQASKALQRGDLTSRALTEALLERIARLQPVLNCFISIEADDALAMADAADAEISAGRRRGPLHGIPLAHKDAFDREGKVTTIGTRIFTEPATFTATAIQRLNDAGAGLISGCGLLIDVSPWLGGRRWVPPRGLPGDASRSGALRLSGR